LPKRLVRLLRFLSNSAWLVVTVADEAALLCAGAGDAFGFLVVVFWGTVV
jgi:hypothetical protein